MFAGDIQYSINDNQTVWNWNAVNYESFLGRVILEPNESILIYGKLSEGRGFCVTAWPLYGAGGSSWGITVPNNHADVVAHATYKVGVNASTVSSGSSSSTQILSCNRNRIFSVSK